MNDLDSRLREVLRIVRDAGALDDNMGGEFWTGSDRAIHDAISAIKDEFLKLVGEDNHTGEWNGREGMPEEITILENDARNQLRAELRSLIKGSEK